MIPGGECPRRGQTIALLSRQLEVWQEEARRKDHIIAALTERIPELEAPQVARQPPKTVSHSVFKDEEPENDIGDSRPPWWRRIFGGPRAFRQP
jgi:hypothetical protein